MIPLTAHGIAHGVPAELVGRVSHGPVPEDKRRHTVRILPGDPTLDALAGYAAGLTHSALVARVGLTPVVFACDTGHLADGDVVSISPQGTVRTLYRRASSSNTLFATDRCNSLCLMCSQPPRDVDDSRRPAELLQLVGLIDPETKELGITGGEPTLLGAGLLEVIAGCRDRLPSTSLHLLSNGRTFADVAYARALGAIQHPDLMVGIPLYSDQDTEHDFVVQAAGAFRETIIGLANLAQANVRIEIRVVIHQHTYRRLPRLAEFIYRNLTFASHVAFMGLEIIGFAKANVDSLWIDPQDYSAELEDAVLMLGALGMNVSVYNHQLCTVPRTLWPYCRQSISDWKNDYVDECTKCGVREQCGGFFTWNRQSYRSRAIRPISR